jgi:glycosyltransferase involved in cell wall biosynthesis
LLRRLLWSLGQQIRGDRLVERVQICISDNASDDDTPGVIDEFQREYPDVVLVRRRHAAAIGFVGNLRSVAALGDAEFIAFTGDDDWIRPRALQRILDACEFPGNVILFNSHPGAGRWLQSLPADDGSRRVLRDGHDANKYLGIFHATFLGNCVFRRRAFNEAFRADYEISMYPHTYVAMHLLARGPGLFVNYETFSIDESQREWSVQQPWLTAVDMARLQSDMVLRRGAARREIAAVYGELSRSVPRAVLHSRRHRGAMPVRPGDLLAGYRCSHFYQALTLGYWLMARVLPVNALEWAIHTASAWRCAPRP